MLTKHASTDTLVVFSQHATPTLLSIQSFFFQIHKQTPWNIWEMEKMKYFNVKKDLFKRLYLYKYKMYDIDTS